MGRQTEMRQWNEHPPLSRRCKCMSLLHCRLGTPPTTTSPHDLPLPSSSQIKSIYTHYARPLALNAAAMVGYCQVQIAVVYTHPTKDFPPPPSLCPPSYTIDSPRRLHRYPHRKGHTRRLHRRRMQNLLPPIRLVIKQHIASTAPELCADRC